MESNSFNLAIGIVAYNNSNEQLRKLFQSVEIAVKGIASTATVEIVFLNNGAPLNLPETSLSVHIQPEQGNIGFAKGINTLLDFAFNKNQFTHFLCTNPDGAFHHTSLFELYNLAMKEQSCLIEAIQFPEEHPKVYDPVTWSVEWVSGACLLIPRKIYEKIGGFDTNFFMYMEDVDFSWRAKQAGFGLKICPKALFSHAVLDRKPDAKVDQWYLQSARYLATKWRSPAKRFWAEDQMLERGYIKNIKDLPQLPPIANRRSFKRKFADFSHMFSFSETRW